jgi:hypothetical protein
MLDLGCTVFRLPLELLLEILSYFADHRRFIRENLYGRELPMQIERKHAERSIVIRGLTMTCWLMRNLFLPILWTDAEAFIPYIRYDHRTGTGGLGSSLRAQCDYLSLNPEIASYVQSVKSLILQFTVAHGHQSRRTFSVVLDLSQAPGDLSRAPEDLMRKFVNCLVQLPSLKTLEILEAGPRTPIAKVLKLKYAKFPGIRTLRIVDACHHIIKNCPGLEDLTFVAGLDRHASVTLGSHGKNLKRVAGVDIPQSLSGELVKYPLVWTISERGFVTVVCHSCPELREIGIVGDLRVSIRLEGFEDNVLTATSQSNSEHIQPLRQLKHLAIVDVNLFATKNAELPEVIREMVPETWKRELIGLLKDSPSTDHKFLRWKIIRNYVRRHVGRVHEIVEAGELEVFPETSL